MKYFVLSLILPFLGTSSVFANSKTVSNMKLDLDDIEMLSKSIEQLSNAKDIHELNRTTYEKQQDEYTNKVKSFFKERFSSYPADVRSFKFAQVMNHIHGLELSENQKYEILFMFIISSGIDINVRKSGYTIFDVLLIKEEFEILYRLLTKFENGEYDITLDTLFTMQSLLTRKKMIVLML